MAHVRTMAVFLRVSCGRFCSSPEEESRVQTRYLLMPQDDNTIVCRCEELTARQIREALDTGLSNPNQVKALTRCGMGPCQGRMCGSILSEIIADHKKMDITDVGYLRIRPPIKPVTLEQLSNMELADALEGVIEIS